MQVAQTFTTGLVLFGCSNKIHEPELIIGHKKQTVKLTAELEMYVSFLPLPRGNPGLGLFSKPWTTTNRTKKET